MKPRFALRSFLALTGGLFFAAQMAQAADGTWTTTTAGPHNWSTAGNWSGSTVADGADFTANFTANITPAQTVNLDSARTIGNITFTDSTTSSHDLTISGANILTLDRTTGIPTIDVTQSGRKLTISSQISGSDGLQKSGAGTLTLSNTNNNYTGGTVLNAGTISFGTNSDVYLGATSGGLTFNGGQITYSDDFVLNRAVTVNANMALNNRITVTGVLSGSSSISQSGSDTATFSNTGNTFTGTITSSYAMSFASLGDSSNSITMGTNGWTWTGSNKTFALRSFTMNGNAAINGSGSGALIIQQNLAHTGATGRTLSLGGSNTTSTNQFAGNIANAGAGAVGLTKGGDNSRWALSGTNTYTGATTLATGGSTADAGFLIFQGMQALSPSTSLNLSQGNSNTRSGTIRILDDSATPASRSTVNLNFNHSQAPTSDNRMWMRLFIGNNSTANLGTSASTQTGSTIQLGNYNLTEGATTSNSAGLWLSGANGYRLQIADVNVTLHGTTNNNYQATLRADNPMTVTGTVRQANDAAVGSNTTLQLEGSAAGSLISGAIRNSAGGRLMNLSKAGAGTWSLSGTNDYTGTTAISAGLLRFTGDSSAATGNVSVTGGALGGNGGSLGGAVTVSSTGGIDLRDNAIGNLTLGSTLGITGAAGANNLYFDLGNTTNTTDKIMVGGATTVTNAGAAVINLNQLGGTAGRNAAGTYTLIEGTTSMDVASDFALATTKAFGQTFSLGVTGNNLELTTTQVTSTVGNVTLSGTNPSWLVGANFTGGTVPDYGSNVTINSNIGTTGALGASTNINSLTYGTSATTATTVAPGTAATGTPFNMLVIEAGTANGNTAGNGITLNNTSGTHTISANVGLAASQTWTVATGGGLTVSGVVSDFGGGYSLTKAGGGTLTLSGTNTYSGGIVITAGRLIAGSDAALGNTSNGITFTGTQGALLLPTGTFTLDSNRSITSQNGAMAVISRENINNNGTINFGGQLTGQGGFQFSTGYQLGGVTYNLSNTNNNFQGALRIGGDYSGVHTFTPSTVTLNMQSLADGVGYGNIQFGRGNGSSGNLLTFNYTNAATSDLVLDNRRIELGSSAETAVLSNSSTTYGIIVNTDLLVSRTGNKTLRLSAASNNNVFAGDIANGTGAVIAIEKAGTGTWALSGTNTFTGDITLSSTTTSAGTLSYASAGGANAIKFLQTTGSATLSYTGSGQTMSGAITANALTTGTITLDASGSGAINYSNTGSLGSTGTLVKNLVLSGTNTDNNTLAGAWVNNGTGAATLTKNGAGKWILTNANTYTGATAISGGTLQLGNGGTTGALTGTASITNNGNLTINRSNAFTQATDLSNKVISGSGSFTQAGAGTTTLSLVNTYNGATNVNAGTLELSGSGSINNTSAINIAAGATLVHNSSTALTVAPTLNGSGSNKATFSGSGTINAAMTLNSIDDVLSPGNSPGIQSFGTSQTWSSFSYDWELNDWAASVTGTNIDQIQISGTLDLDGAAYALNILSLDSLNAAGLVGAGGGNPFAEVNNSWTILTTSGGISNFNALEWTINAGGFLDAETGNWGLNQVGNNLVLSYAAIPEPSSALLVGLSSLLLFRRRR